MRTKDRRNLYDRAPSLTPLSLVSILVFGFLYHMTDHCPSVDVEDPSDTVASDWFLSALQEGVESGESLRVREATNC